MTKTDRPAQDAGKRDRWGLPFVRSGHLRGKVANLRFTSRESAFGLMKIVDFDLLTGEGQAPVPVRMEGNDFTGMFEDGWLIDVPDPNPGVRPLLTRRINGAQGDAEVMSHYPGRDEPAAWRDRLMGNAMIFVPVLVSAILAALIVWYFFSK